MNESGASIYSASPEAVKELPDMDVSLRGAGNDDYINHYLYCTIIHSAPK